MAMSAAQWRDQLLALLPRGRAWSREPGSQLYNLAHGLAEHFARADARIDAMLVEADPRLTSELIEEWEQRYGLPRCENLELSLSGRRAVVVEAATHLGSGAPQHLIDIADAVGYEITIDENTPDAGTFTVNAPTDTVTQALFGIARYGERYQEWGNALLDCLLGFYKHAHLQYNIAFPEE